MLSEFPKHKYLEALDKNERAKALHILNEELKVLKPFDGKLFSDMTNLLMIENISIRISTNPISIYMFMLLDICAFLYHYRKKSVFWENAQLSTYTDDVTARGVLASELKKLIEMNPELRHKCQLPTHQLRQNPNSDADVTSILVDHSCGPQNAAQGQVHVANEFSYIRRSGGLQLANNVNEVDGSVSLMNVEAQAEKMALDVKTFIDFKIIYGGLCIDNEFSEDIGETVSIAAKIKNTKLTTAKEELETWDSILRAFELLGMKVGFLRDRKHLLATFLFESEAEPAIQSYVKSKYELERVESKIPKVEEKLKALKESAKKCANVLDSLRHKVETYENIFK
ncbi:DNA-binding pseudobarrel domain-containing protein [Artemisia annua]|uniref:DNA-binding pseudobarrel domain-containing protein n=1 Tax=Artemisia annua TaxID=35608 RepID=A0A2U1LNV9_ARTAN|nr:DNA-binding pseudobarrel domain-containing protein [Artemisia annua]